MGIARPATAVVCALVLGWSGAGVATAAGSGAAAAPNLSCGEVISASVTLTGNLHCDGTGLIVDADNDVTLDLGGHTVTGNGTGDGIVLSSSDEPDFTYTLENGRISGFASGVLAGAVSVADVNGVTITASPTAVEFGAQLSDFSLANSRITGATNDFFYGPGVNIVFVDVTSSTIIGGAEQIITGLGEGYYHDDHITDSAVTFETPGNDVISDNVFDDSMVDEGTFGGQLIIEDNTFENAQTGLLDYSLGGDTISGNTFKGNVGVGAFLYLSVDANLGDDAITDNRFIDNGASGLYVAAAGEVSVGTISSNTATGNGFQPDGQLDFDGHLLADGITVDQNFGPVTVADNHSSRNAAFGIWLDQTGTVTDGGGNTSHRDPQGCAPSSLCRH